MRHTFWFCFKGKDSRSYGIEISKMPDIVKPSRRVRSIELPGRSGTLTEDAGTYNDYSISIGCGVFLLEDIDSLTEWLDGAGELILSQEPDKVYHARLDNAVNFTGKALVHTDFILQFQVEPFKYSVNSENDTVVFSKGMTLYNKGNYFAEPVITMYGNGDMVLVVNGMEYPLEGVNGSIVIDTPLMEVYRGSENQAGKFKSRNFPTFKKGWNTVSFSGGVTKVEVVPNWRWV